MSRLHRFVATAILAGLWAALAAGCVTVGYDFINQRATVTVDPNKGFKK